MSCDAELPPLFRVPRSAFRVRSMKRHQSAATREPSAGGVAGARAREGRRGVTAVVLAYHPRREARRAVKSGYPREAGSVCLCRSLQALERLLYQRLVDAVVIDVKAPAVPTTALALPARFPRIPRYVLSAFRPDDGTLLSACHAAGFTGILVG